MHSSNFCLHSLVKIVFKFSPLINCFSISGLLISFTYLINSMNKSAHNFAYNTTYPFSFVAFSRIISIKIN